MAFSHRKLKLISSNLTIPAKNLAFAFAAVKQDPRFDISTTYDPRISCANIESVFSLLGLTIVCVNGNASIILKEGCFPETEELFWVLEDIIPFVNKGFKLLIFDEDHTLYEVYEAAGKLNRRFARISWSDADTLSHTDWVCMSDEDLPF